MSEVLAELERVVVASQPADDYAPSPMLRRNAVLEQGMLFGASSVSDPWTPFFEQGWTYNGPLRDRYQLAGDFWRAALRWGLVQSRLHPNQIRLFDPDELK